MSNEIFMFDGTEAFKIPLFDSDASLQEAAEEFPQYIYFYVENESITIEEFLTARIHDVMCKITGFPLDTFMDIRNMCEAQLWIIQWHKEWPVFVHDEPKFERSPNPEDNTLTLTMSQRMEWLTEQEYRKKFGTEPPTAPIIKKMAMAFAYHPDFNEEWAVE